ncbi:MAG TPA: mycofactocin-coupled SDR family oxidoreductase [Acidimicrobiales bacterium]|nr:mycofactocin-coupled SDR family oxidoreductase [Acidimicrobiales bacterium]
MTSVAIVTGAARGIGAATAIQLADAGWRVVLFDRVADDPALSYPLARPSDLEGVAHRCGGPSSAVAVAGDVRDQADLDRAVATAVSEFGGLDAAVAVAGAVAGGEEAWLTSDETWSTMISINLEGTWRLARAAVPALLRRPEPRQGRFIAVASAGGQIGLYMMAAYTAAKHGVVGLVRSLATELGPHGMTANVVAPGSTRGAMLDASAAVYGLADAEEFASHHMLPRLLAPSEPAALIAWLCGPDSSGITGAVLPVDAGMTAR